MMKALSLVLLAVFFLQDAKCMAASAPGNRASKIRVVSIRKNGGESKTFDFAGQNTLSSETTSVGGGNSLWKTLSLGRLRQKTVTTMRSTFLPSGYPARTPPGYLKYCMCSWIQDMSTQLRSVLATQRVLEGVGVGREGATALSALMNYLVRDGCGMAATLLFTSAASTKFRTDVKRWRLFADIMVDLGITLEVTALLVPRSFFLPMICLGNMCKATCGVAAGACGGSINLHWAKGSDISDINAKFGAQHTVTGALGLIFAAFFARSVDHVNATVLWALYATLTIGHVVANVWCMRLIAFDSCNTARMNLLLGEFFDWWKLHEDEDSPHLPELSSPTLIAEKEPLFFGIGTASNAPGGLPVRVGVSFDEFWEASGDYFANVEQVQHLDTTRDNYLVTATSTTTRKNTPALLLVFLSHVTGFQEAKAYFHASWLGRELQKANEVGRSIDPSSIKDFESNKLPRAWDYFRRSLKQSGWDLSKTELTTWGYEVEFTT